MAAKKGSKVPRIAIEVTERSPVDVFAENYADYGALTLEDRALPDFRDGLLKVHRRTLWATSHVAKHDQPHVKTARIVGEVLGKFHPHGDDPVQGAIETMVWTPSPLMDGSGNWGTQTDNAAHMRYTNCRLSEYSADTLFHKDYMATVNLHPNYDGKDVEPELLPARLPNILLNGVSGIGVGLSTNIPSFALPGVLTLFKGMLKGRRLTLAACKKHLEFVFPFGGEVPKEDYNDEAFESLMTNGRGSFYTVCEYDYDLKERTVTITAIPPRMRPDTLINNLRSLDCFSSVTDNYGRHSTTPAEIVCTVKRGVKVENAAQEMCDSGSLVVKVAFQIAVVERRWVPEERRIRSDIHQFGVIDLFNRWFDWRLDLEKRMLECKTEALTKEIAKFNLLLLAQQNRKVIAESWEKDDQRSYVAGKLKISQEDAAYVCGLRVSQLGKLDRQELQDKIKKLTADREVVEGFKEDLPGSILASL